MNIIQKILITIYIPLTLLIIIYDNIFPQEIMVNYLRYFIIGTLMLVALISIKEYPEHPKKKYLSRSLIFVFIADFFLVFSKTIDFIEYNLNFLGLLGFMLAYICLIRMYKTKSKNKVKDLISSTPVIVAFALTVMELKPYLEGVLFIGSLIFAIVIYYMLWTSICTLNRDYYSKKVSYLIATSGILMVICDMGVAFSMFHPNYAIIYSPLLKNIIWGAYIPAWTIVVVIINEKNLYKRRSCK